MQIPKPFTAFLSAVFLAASLASAGQVISWVAPYKVDQSKAMLQKDFGGVGMKDGLTWLALQFWVTNGPNVVQDGNVAGAGFDDKVKWFRDWGHANGIKVTLCVTDFVGDWNWPEARRSFLDNRAAFVKSLVAEADRLGLDGVELDLEGNLEATAADVSGFIAFSAELAAALHPKGKTVTVASFAAQWNAPNWKWWPELMKSVDGVTSMGYEKTGRNSNNGYNYADQKKQAIPPYKLMIGMPGYFGSWEGNTAAEQLDWAVQDGEVGVGIWDCGLDNGAWQTAAVWKQLAKIRASKPAAVAPEITSPSFGNAPTTLFHADGSALGKRRHMPVFGKRR
ncbi:MAG: hypothetical protein JWO30_2716 [Fibrobacteres bacterium]|nr:hypothetical protein [Fibrobacterota bacterium]